VVYIMAETHVASALRAKRAEISGYIHELEKKIGRLRANLIHISEYGPQNSEYADKTVWAGLRPLRRFSPGADPPIPISESA
jgi:hypothetical protein